MAILYMALWTGELKNDEKRAITPRRVIKFTRSNYLEILKKI
jgi:hypothetical protein